MKVNRMLAATANRIGKGVDLRFVKKNARLKSAFAKEPMEIVGFDYIVEGEGICYEYYCANPPLIGMTEPMPRARPVGLEAFEDFNVNYEEAIKVFHSGNWGDSFTSLALYKPLVYPEAKEPFWYFTSNLDVTVFIGANTGIPRIIETEKMVTA